MPYEYAISAGEGTLIDYGVCDGVEMHRDRFWIDDLEPPLYSTWSHLQDYLLIVAPCEYSCETGK